jgi:hypothetical protein
MKRKYVLFFSPLIVLCNGLLLNLIGRQKQRDRERVREKQSKRKRERVNEIMRETMREIQKGREKEYL